MTPRLTIGITSRNRQASLRRCVSSMALLADLPHEILVFDDGSEIPVEEQIADLPAAVRVVRGPGAPGYIVGRNQLVRDARAPYVLLVDDDTWLLSDAAVLSAIRVLDSDRSVAAVAFAQAEKDGSPWPEGMQPSPARRPTVVASFIGFAHLLRRDDFLALGGYREAYQFYGEEKDYGLRVCEAGRRIVYLPDALIVHAADPSGRDARRYLRFVSRNDCLMAIYDEPLGRLVWMLPARFALYFRMRAGWKIRDPWGAAWLAKEILTSLPALIRDRRPVRRSTIARWTALKRHETPYEAAG